MIPDIHSLTEYENSASVPAAQFVVGVAGEVLEWVFEDWARNRAVDVSDEPSVVRCGCYPAATAVLFLDYEGPAVRAGGDFEDGVAIGVLTRWEMAFVGEIVKV